MSITAYSFGASTAAGSVDSEGGFIARVDRYLRDTGTGTAVNHGVGGDTTTMMLERLDSVVADMRKRESPLALVTLGINDVPRIVDDSPEKRVDLDLHAASLKRILAELGQVGDVVYLTQYPVDYEARSLSPELVEAYVKKERWFAFAAQEGVCFDSPAQQPRSPEHHPILRARNESREHWLRTGLRSSSQPAMSASIG